jgi:hypothetical protein
MIHLYYEDLDYQISKIKRNFNLVKMPFSFFINYQKKIANLYKKDEKAFSFEKEADFKNHYHQFKKICFKDLDTFNAYIEDEEDDLVLEAVTFDDIVHMYAN